MTVQARAELRIIDDRAEIIKGQSPKGKPFIRLMFPDGTTVDITANLAQMIGGAGAGMSSRYGLEDW